MTYDTQLDFVIQNHRKMWNWIADKYDQGDYTSVVNLKKLYLEHIAGEQISGNCYLSNYAGPSDDFCCYAFNCERCPLDWGTPENSSITEGFCVDSLYYADESGLYGTIANLTETENYCPEDASELARKIANLPLKKGVEED